MRSADYMIWGLVIHLVVDWLGQNEWIATKKAARLTIVLDNPPEEKHWWWLRHPAAYIHAGMHGAAQLLIFPWWAALFIGVTHLLIDTRVPVAWWSKLIRQTQPMGFITECEGAPRVQLFDIGQDVRIWADQVWHVGVIAVVALAVLA